MKSSAASRRVWLLAPLAAGIAVAPMAVHGPSYGHDFNFHLLNWMEAARQFSHGTVFPRWAYTPAYNAGEPRFVFYPPASWVLGALLGWLLSHLPGVRAEIAWTAVPIVFTWICLAGSGVTMFVAARRFATAQAAAFASLLYVVNPYMLFTAYERSAYAELLAAAWMPLLVSELVSANLRMAGVAVPIALLWLTNAPAAVIGCYAAVALLGARVLGDVWADDTGVLRRLIAPASAGLVLGIALPAFYLLPAAWERRYVQVAMATIVNMGIDHNFLFEHTGSSADALTHDEVLRTASWIAVSLLVAAALAVVGCWRDQRQDDSVVHGRRLPAGAMLLFLAAVTFLLTSPSNLVWQHTPELRFLQFPWRWLTVVAPVFAIAMSVAISRVRLAPVPTAVGAIAICAAVTFLLYKPLHQQPEPGLTVGSQLQAFERGQGAEPTDEYTPETADNDALTPGNPPYWLAATSTAAHPAKDEAGPAPMHFTVDAPQPEFLILNLRDYPAWRVQRNGRVQTEREQRDDGLVALAVPAGESTIDIAYEHGADEWLGAGVSAGALALLGTIAFRRHRKRRSYTPVRATSGENFSVSGE